MFENTRQLDGVGAESVIAGVKSAPPVAVAALSAGGVALQDWVLLATLAYILLQAAYLAWKWLREARAAGKPGR